MEVDSVRTITTPNEVVVSEALATRLFLLSLLGVVALPYLRRKFYIQPLAGDTFLRVGLGGMKVVREREGCWFFSHFHILAQVPLRTFRVNITQRVITRDHRSVDLDVAFFVRVSNTDQDIKSAARSLTQDPGNHVPAHPIRAVTSSITNALETRLEVYLRLGAASVTFNQLLDRTIPWLQEGLSPLIEDLRPYGLTLETATLNQIRG